MNQWAGIYRTLFALAFLAVASLACGLGSGGSGGTSNPVSLVGKTADDREVKNFLKNNHCERGVVFRNYMCKSVGIELGMYNTDQVKAVMLFAEGVSDYQQYKGSLPNDLYWEDTRADVNQKLGEPEEHGLGLDQIYYWYHYKNEGLWVYFNTRSADDFTANIVEVKKEYIP